MTRPTHLIPMRTLIRGTFSIIRSDYVVLLPSLIVAFLIILLGTGFFKDLVPATSDTEFLKKSVPFMLVFGFINLFAQAVTILLCDDLSKKSHTNIADAFVRAVRRFPVLIVLLLLAFAIGSLLFYPLNLAPKAASIFLWAPMIFIVTIFAQLFPVIVMVEDPGFTAYFRIIFTIMTRTFMNCLRLFVLLMMIGMGSVFLGSLIESGVATPAVKQVLLPLLQGAANAISTIITVVFYHTDRSSISVNV